MADISVSLSSSQAEKMLPLLQKIRGGASGEERKIIDGLLQKLGPQIEKAKEMQGIQMERQMCSDAVCAMAQVVVDTLPLLRRKGVSNEVVRYINTVDTIFQKAETSIQDAHKAYISTLPKADRDSAELPSDIFLRTLAPSRKKLERSTEDFKGGQNTPLEASGGYSLGAKRMSLAKKCLGTGLSVGSNAEDWGEIDMVSLCFADMNTHMKLGVALLGGNATKIEEASNMDTGCRDGLDEKVWDFVSNDLDKIERVSTRKLGR